MMTSSRDAAAVAVAAAAVRADAPRRLHLATTGADAARARAIAASSAALEPSRDAPTSANSSVATNANVDLSRSAQTAGEPQRAADMRSQTCMEFLHIMKEFSESSCDASEMVQRVDSLVNQDEQLLRLFPLTRKQAEAQADATATTTATTINEGEDEAARRLRRALEDDEDDELMRSAVDTDRIDTSSTAAAGLAAMPGLGSDALDRRAPATSNDSEMEAQDELQRWMDLDLELDQPMDVFDFHQEQSTHQRIDVRAASANHAASSAAAASTTTSSAVSPFTQRGSSNSLFQSQATQSSVDAGAGYLRGHGVSYAPQKSLQAAVKSSCSPLSKKSVTAALFDDDDDDGLEMVLSSGLGNSRLSGPPLKRPKVSRPSNASLLHVSTSRESKAEMEEETSKPRLQDEEESNVWGMENDGYEQDLLSSIDHAVLCDRENRFLQWDLEMATQQQQEQEQEQRRLLATATSVSTSGCSEALATSRVGSRVSSSASSTTSSCASVTGSRVTLPTQKLTMASSPRDSRSSKSPSNVDIVEDWNSLDFGTFQNRTVSHILSSCLHKRKLHHPYKNQVKLVNFSVPGGGPDGEPTVHSAAGPHPHQLGGSLASSLAFGGQAHNGLDASGNPTLNGFVPLLASSTDGGLGLGVTGVKSPGGKGDKKTPKKREERKRLLTLKMQETFADLEATFTEQDLDVKGIVGPGASLSKMALSKLENLPLPELSNLPQDLRELKRKIEATEHKVEGTKHRHRKGGPCPRCQVQNQLRAAKRAYHKRAVAHKKLPHVVVNAVNDQAQEAAVESQSGSTLEVPSISPMSEKPNGVSKSSVKKSGGSSTTKSKLLTHATLKPGDAASARPGTSLCSSTASTSVGGSAGSTSGSASASPVSESAFTARGSCGKAAASSDASSPETASQLQHVTVSSG